MILTLFHGFCMALTGCVPGVSGGTVAFIMGFYERFLGALHNMTSRDKALRRSSWGYLIKLGAGWILGMITAVLVLSRVLETNVYLLSSVFLGLTATAIPFVASAERKNLAGKPLNLIWTLLGVGIVIALTAGRAALSRGGAIDFSSLTAGTGLYLVLTGMVAITAMTLPGISGSTLLLIFGVYAPAVSAMRQMLKLNFSGLPGVLAIIGGIVLGIVGTTRLIHIALEKHRSVMIFLMLGLMAGSLYSIVIGPTTLSSGNTPLNFGNFSIPGFLCGAIFLLALEFIRKKQGGGAEEH